MGNRPYREPPLPGTVPTGNHLYWEPPVLTNRGWKIPHRCPLFFICHSPVRATRESPVLLATRYSLLTAIVEVTQPD